MEDSNVAGWIALGSFVLAAGMLVRNRLRSDGDDLETEMTKEYISAMVAAGTLGSVPELFDLGHWAVQVGVDIVALAFTVFGLRQIFRLLKHKKVAVDE